MRLLTIFLLLSSALLCSCANTDDVSRDAYRQDDAVWASEANYIFSRYALDQDYCSMVKEAAERGDAMAQFNLGAMYFMDYGVPEDSAMAVKWYRKAAEQGHVEAHYHLVLMYENGEGVAQDHVEAVKWYRKAAEQGNSSAQYKLGHKYAHGYGVPKDGVEAVKWYRKAAEQGHAYAQYPLGDMYMYGHGDGVAIDHVEAVK